jgi:group I intron endonuclease
MIIYKIENTINGKVYIGQTILSTINKRMIQHLSTSKNSKLPLYNAIRKHGWDKFDKHPIEDNIKTTDDLNAAEIYWIRWYDSKIENGMGYNIDNGGNSIGSMSEEHKKNIYLAHKGIKLTEEHKKKLSEARKGKKHSEETKNKMSETHKNKGNKSLEHCNNISKGKKSTSDELDAKILAEINLTQEEMAKKYNINRNTVRRILNNRNR